MNKLIITVFVVFLAMVFSARIPVNEMLGLEEESDQDMTEGEELREKRAVVKLAGLVRDTPAGPEINTTTTVRTTRRDVAPGLFNDTPGPVDTTTTKNPRDSTQKYVPPAQ